MSATSLRADIAFEKRYIHVAMSRAAKAARLPIAAWHAVKPATAQRQTIGIARPDGDLREQN
jgi:hypothetical protein